MAEVWPFVPQRGMTESLEWATDVLRARGAEQRISLRPTARQGFQFDLLLDSTQLALAKSLARFAGATELLVPCWQFISRIGALPTGTTEVAMPTQYAPYRVGDSVIVWQEYDRYEVCVLTGVASGLLTFSNSPLSQSYDLAFVMPLRPCLFAQDFEVSRTSHPIVKAQARFETTEYVSLEGSGAAPSYPVYLGHDVLTDRTVLLSDVRERYVREAAVFDSELGRVWSDPAYLYPIQSSTVSWSLDDRASLWAVRAWLDARRGRWKGFWMPSWNSDLVLVEGIDAIDSTLRVRDARYRYYEGERHLMVLRTGNQTPVFLRVTSAEAGIGGTELLTLSTAVGVAIPLAQVEAVCFLTFMRFDADRIEIKHRAAQGANIAVAVTEAPVP